METDHGCLTKGSTFFSFRSVIRCEQRNARHQCYNVTWICSFKLYYLLLLSTTIHGWLPNGPVLTDGTLVCVPPWLSHSPLICAHNKSTKNEFAGNTQKGWNPLHPSSCRADLCFMAFFFTFVTGLFKGSLMVQVASRDWREMCDNTIRRSR